VRLVVSSALGHQTRTLLTSLAQGQCVSLGSLDELRRRASDCAFCSVILKATKQTNGPWETAASDEIYEFAVFPEPYATLRYDDIEWLEDSSPLAHESLRRLTGHIPNMYGGISWNILTITLGLHPVDRLDTVVVQLQPSLHPVPSVEDSHGGHLRNTFPFPGGRLFGSLVDPRLIRRWLLECKIKHGTPCEQPAWYNVSTNPLPRQFRLIDVQDECIVDASKDIEYLSLSYVWGAPRGSRRFQATCNNIDSLKVRGSLNCPELPDTIRDAMELVSTLGYRYLWVDALYVKGWDVAPFFKTHLLAGALFKMMNLTNLTNFL
jgi:hypothetical protein